MANELNAKDADWLQDTVADLLSQLAPGAYEKVEGAIEDRKTLEEIHRLMRLYIDSGHDPSMMGPTLDDIRHLLKIE